MTVKTRAQRQSQQAYAQIKPLQNIQEKDGQKLAWGQKEKKKYGALCHNFPIMILQNGLSQSVAFIWVKAEGVQESPHGKYLQHMAHVAGYSNITPEAFQQKIYALNLNEYTRITREILEASIWYKRFAESLLGVSGGE